MKRLIRRLWGSEEPFRRFAIEAVAFLLATWAFLLLYSAGHEIKTLLYTSELIAVVMCADFLGYAGLYFWEGR